MKIKNFYKKIFLHLLILVSIIFLIGCPGRKRDETEFMRSQVDSLRNLAKNFIIESSTKSYENYVFGKNLNLYSIYKKYPTLFTEENINLLNDLLKIEQRPERVDRLERLKVYIYSEIVNKPTSKDLDKIENLKTSSYIQTDKGSVPFYRIHSLIANEPKQKIRERLFKATDGFYNSLNQYYLQLYKKQVKIVDSLRFKSFFQFCEMIREINFSSFRKTIENFMSSTNDIYFSLLDDILRQNKLNRDQFYRYDIPFILRNNKFDKYFKKDSLISVWKNSLASMGIMIDSLTNIHLDLEDRQTKNPRAACFPINIPDDIRMSVKPIGGFDDYSALFHESGHSLHYGLTKESAIEYTYLGDNTVTETYAFLLEHILDEPNWLKTNLKMKESEIKNFIKFRAFQRLFMVRRYCAKFLYELQLYDTLVTAPQKYDELLSTALGYKSTPSDKKLYLDDVDPFFYVVDYLRAWFIEAMFKTKLRELFGDDWYNNTSIKEYLSDFFQNGQKFTIDKFIQKIGFTDLDPKFLANEISEMKSFSRKK